MYEVHYWASQTRFFRPKKSPKPQYMSRFAATAIEIYPNIPRFTSIFVYFCLFLPVFAYILMFLYVFALPYSDVCIPLLPYLPPLSIFQTKKRASPPSLPFVYGVKLNNLIPLILTI